MGEQAPTIEDGSGQLRCVGCNKVLAKQFESANLEIKCKGCGTVNVVSGRDIARKEE